jgi:hypothetical protein
MNLLGVKLGEKGPQNHFSTAVAMRKPMIAAGVALGIFLPLVYAGLTYAGADCLEYGPAVVKLTGKAIIEKYPLQSYNYRTGDMKVENVDFEFLLLDKPICVKGKEGDEYSPPQTDIRKIELKNVNKTQQKVFNTCLNRKIVVTGKLFGRHTRYHRGDVLIMVESITPAN